LANTGEFIICVFVFSFKVSRGFFFTFLIYVVIILLAFIIT